jgi:hypothetical protein
MKHAEPGVQARGAAGAERLALEPPVFVAGTITEIAGPGLRIEAPLQVGVDDRALIMFQMNDTGAAVVSDIGRVRYVKKMTDGYSLAVELGGLSEADVEGLVRFANARQSQTGGPSSSFGAADVMATGSHAMIAGGTA